MGNNIIYQQNTNFFVNLGIFILVCFIYSGCSPTYVTRVPDPEKPLVFPYDHGGHDDAQWEWWYYNGRLESESGKTYDFFWSFFKVYVDGDSVMTIPMSVLTLPLNMYFPFHFGGFSILDHKEDKYATSYKCILPFFWTGGYRKYDLGIWLGKNKSWRDSDNIFHIQCDVDGYELDLRLKPQNPPILYGKDNNGTLLPPDTVHRYYSYTRMKTEGTLKKGKHKEKVTGISWMDHEYGLIYHKDFQAWHWFCATLDNGVDIVFGLVNYFSGEIVPESFCTIRYPDGRTEFLEKKDFHMKPSRTWKSGLTGVTFGIDWEFEVPKFNLKLQGKAIRDKQEMIIPPIIFWEGPCEVTGLFEGQKVKGRGFLETFGDFKVPFRRIYRSEMKNKYFGREEG